MSEELELPDDVVAAIRSNRKIEAIKLLREHANLGLKDAKDRVDAYTEMHPPSVAASSQQTDSGIGRLLLVCLLGAVGYVVYQFLT